MNIVCKALYRSFVWRRGQLKLINNKYIIEANYCRYDLDTYYYDWTKFVRRYGLFKDVHCM